MSDRPSPIDGAPMRKMRRYGVEMDVCTRTGGVWLDGGELERVVARIRGEDSHRRSRAEDTTDPTQSDEDGRMHRVRQQSLHARVRLADDFDF
jgi:Zn-finger nucleic acid-binding protein